MIAAYEPQRRKYEPLRPWKGSTEEFGDGEKRLEIERESYVWKREEKQGQRSDDERKRWGDQMIKAGGLRVGDTGHLGGIEAMVGVCEPAGIAHLTSLAKSSSAVSS